eukprot:TRINITY_DN10941_c0_g2_i1.p2 TRINITY_DN10941_c0_g2~~TRINITY_DN10941_c0_g2_i1.p2  ORF type:complete len:570 (+),score=93.50 TRINITY_DN10941_c0_g2_i1:205-1914(+)
MMSIQIHQGYTHSPRQVFQTTNRYQTKSLNYCTNLYYQHLRFNRSSRNIGKCFATRGRKRKSVQPPDEDKGVEQTPEDEQKLQEQELEAYKQRQLKRKEEVKALYEEVEMDEEFMKEMEKVAKEGEELGEKKFEEQQKEAEKMEEIQNQLRKEDDEEYAEDDDKLIDLEEQFGFKPIMKQQYLSLMLEEYSNTFVTKELTETEVNEAIASSFHENAHHYKAFYSSEFGGVITHPELMMVYFDDHMVHRGHSVFDTTMITGGYVYQLDEHFMRFLNSAIKAGLDLPFHPRQMRRIILDTCAYSREFQNAQVRYWLTAGRGGFGLSTKECLNPGFYVMVYTTEKIEPLDYPKGWDVITSRVPVKHPYFATLKSTNYLYNALAVIDAEQHGAQQGMFVDRWGYIQEGPNMNVGFIRNKTFFTPPFEKALGGITMQRLIHLAREAMKNGMLLESLHEETCPNKIEVRPVHYEELFDKEQPIEEVFLTSSSLPLMPIVSWDGMQIGDGEAGETSMAFKALLEGDWDYRPGSDVHVQVPYGLMTGMDDDMDDRVVNHIPMIVDGMQLQPSQLEKW